MSLLSQRNLAGGILAPALQSRVDTVKYQTGVRQARNFTIIRSGGMQNRPGSRFVGETKIRSSANTVRLIPFIFNADQTYMLEFGDLYMRVIKNGAYVLNSVEINISDVTQAAEAVVTSVAHGYENGTELYFSGVVGMTELNGQNFIVSDKTTDTFKIKYLDGTYVDSTGFTAYSSGGTIRDIYEIETIFEYEDLDFIQYSQSGDVITLVNGINFPQELSRIGDASWTIDDAVLVPQIDAPTSVNFSDGASGDQIFGYQYKVTAVSSDNFEESYAGESGYFIGIYEPTSTQPHNISWDAVVGAAYYNVYVSRSGNIGFIGTSDIDEFVNNGITPDFTKTPPVVDEFLTPGEGFIKPACVSHAQQRRIFGNNGYQGGTDQPEEIRTSRTGIYNNFSTSLPAQSDDSVRVRMAGRQSNEIRHILDINRLVVMTANGEFTVEGGGGFAITPTDINIRQYSYNGSSRLSPIVIDANAIYVQARGSIVRDFGFDYTVDGYKGSDLTVFSNHLFDGYQIVDWDYQKTPNSVVWAVRDDGKMLSLTYIREHQIWGWTIHDTDGFYERVAVIPEGNEDTVYTVVRRTIDGRQVRYVEAFCSRFIPDGGEKDMIFMDSSLSFDGRNTNTSHTIEITNLSGDWTAFEQVAAESSVAMFTSGSIGEQLQVTGPDGEYVVLTIESILDPSNAICRPDRTVAEGLRATPVNTWTRAVNTISGLRHLEGKQLSIFADATVVGSPNNPDNTVFTVSDGQVVLDSYYGVIHLGLPYISDIETLSIDNAGGESLIDKKMIVSRVLIQVEKTRGLWAGTTAVPDDAESAIEGLMEFKVRDQENYDSPVALKTGIMDVATESQWDDNGRVFLRQIDPLPATISSISPSGEFPIR